MLRSARRFGFTLVELLLVIAIIALLVGLVMAALPLARRSSLAARCASNLGQIGKLISIYLAEHADKAAPCICDRDESWGGVPEIGWDISTGLFAGVRGGPGTIWKCEELGTSFVGNARALGIDNRGAYPGGRLHLVGPTSWKDAGRLVLAYDPPTVLIDEQIEHGFGHATRPETGDLSDEWTQPWIWDEPEPTIVFGMNKYGPHHNHAYGALFADGHSAVRRYFNEGDGILWSGPRWWHTPRAVIAMEN